MKKQIEEMRNEIHEAENEFCQFCRNRRCHECEYYFAKTDCRNQLFAEHLYNAGYRKQEWISVEERLPEEDVRVLVWLKEDHRTTYTRIDTDRLFNGKWVRWGGCATHWMPLPPPPKNN